MVDILKKLNLEALKDKFISEKLTPDIILKLSLTELKILGLTDANDIMKLKAQWRMWDIMQGASSLGVKFKRKISAWYDELFPS